MWLETMICTNQIGKSLFFMLKITAGGRQQKKGTMEKKNERKRTEIEQLQKYT